MAINIAPKNRITKDGKKYYYRFYFNNKRYCSKLFKTKSEAEKAEKEHKILLMGEKKRKTKPKQKEKGITFKELYNEFYDYKLDKVKQTTLYSYRMRIPFFKMFDDLEVKDFDSDKYLVWRSYMVNQNLSIRTLNGILKFLKELLNYAYKWHDIYNRKIYNMLENFRDADALPEEMNYLNIKEFKQYVSVIKDLKYLCLFELLFFCGLRRGELLGLQWKNIELNKGLIHIRNNVIMPHNGKDYWQMTSPKNRTSIRTIPLPAVLIKHLKQYKKELKIKNNDFNENWFISNKSTPLPARTLAARNEKYIKISGVKHIRLHDFRHSCASLLINNGANVLIVAKYLGHAKLEETLNTYSHLYDEKLSEITVLIDKLEI